MKIKKILIVDSDHYFREVLSNCLNALNYKVLSVENFKQALKAIDLFSPDIVLTDVELPEESGLDLLRLLAQTHPKLPCVLMAGHPQKPIDADKAIKLGAAGYLSKPFGDEEVDRLIKSLLKGYPQAPKEEIDTTDKKLCEADFCKVAINEFFSGKSLRYSIYVKIGTSDLDSHFVLVAHAGEESFQERIDAYKAKGLKTLYIKTEDFRSYVGLLQQAAGICSKAPSQISSKKKATLITHALQQVNQEIMVLPLSGDALDHLKSILESSIKVMSSEDSTCDLLESLQNCSGELFSHSAFVSMVAVLIAKELKWDSPLTLVKVATAGFLHDIGKRQLPADLINKKKTAMTGEEILLYKTHPLLGFEILSELGHYQTDILQAVLHHHERQDGSGYPSRFTSIKIIPLAGIIGVADEFSHDCERFKGSGKLNLKEAVNYLKSMKSQALYKPALSALEIVIQSMMLTEAIAS